MALFQKSILKSITQDESLIASRWNNFQNYLAKIDFIKTVKEEKFQAEFLQLIFEKCLGYTLDTTNPQNFNLEREKKNETDGKKADGVIVVNGEIIGVVELKDQKTKNLDHVEAQAFNYHNSHSNSKYIIISNFDEVRFYIDKKTAYETFNLFYLTYEDFKTLHLLLSFESIKEGIPLKLKEKSVNFEATISKELYRDFSAFRTHLFENIVKNNDTCHPELDSGSQIADQVRNDGKGQARNDDTSVIPCYDTESITKQTLLRLTQKLCDRIIFILFAEDRGLLHPNTIKEIREEFKTQKFTSYHLYDIYKFYFEAINTGNEKLGIPKYNGGLFAPDALLESLIIDDAYLDMEAQKLSDYDFKSDISVNILGHIFEQSLTDLEEMEKSFSHPESPRHPELDSGSKIADQVRNDKKKSKRKKDGVFYTPEYITRYIVQNTLGKLCADKKDELTIKNEPLIPHNLKKLTKEEMTAKANFLAYREWLTHLKILDPACGSGAFLNQALEFLIREHTLIRDLLLPFQDLMIGYEIEKSILEHNLYGVDINEDAVEIAKLSLWLRTAHRGRELTSLNDKIKCGNSLISDRSIAENAFVWEEEFPEVFNPRHPEPFRHPELDSGSKIADQVRNDEKGQVRNDEKRGFDVVIGNPPYVRQEMINNEIKEKYIKNYQNVAMTTADLYVYFYELSIKLLKERGLLGFITPNKWMERKYGLNLRNYLKSYRIEEIINFGELSIFDDASTEPAIIILQNQLSNSDIPYVMIKSMNEAQLGNYQTVLYKKSELSDDIWRFTNPLTTSILTKFKDTDTTLKSYTKSGVFYGVKTGLNKAFIINENTNQEIMNKDKNSIQLLKKMVEGDDFGKWELNHSGRYMVATGYDLDIREKYPAIFEYLEGFRDELIKRQDKGVHYWNLRACDYYDKLEKPKLIYYHTALNHKFYYDTDGYYISANCYFIANADTYLQAVLNSKLFDFVKKYLFPSFGDAEKGGRVGLDANKMNMLPIKKAPSLTPYTQNIQTLLVTPKKPRYDNETKIPIASFKGKDIFVTEFLYAKNRGIVEDLRGHGEIDKNYFRLLPFIFINEFDEIYQNLDNHRFIYSNFDGDGRRIFHIMDESNNLVSVYIISEDRFKRQINKKFKAISSNLQERAVVSSILSPAGPFWRQASLIEQLYTYFSKNTLTQDSFILLVNEILEAKTTLKKYKKHYESLSAVDKIEIKEATEKLEARVLECEKEIDAMVYKLYGLSGDEIVIVEGRA